MRRAATACEANDQVALRPCTCSAPTQNMITNALYGDALRNAEQPRREVGKPAPLAAGTAAATGSAGARRDCSAAATYTLSRSARRAAKPLRGHLRVRVAVGGGAAERLNIAQVGLEGEGTKNVTDGRALVRSPNLIPGMNLLRFPRPYCTTLEPRRSHRSLAAPTLS